MTGPNSRYLLARPWVTIMAMQPRESLRTDSKARGLVTARWWHWATFGVGVFGVGVQLWIVATHPVATGDITFPAPMRLWNALSYFTIWSNILVTAVAYLLARDPQRRGPVFAVFRLASVVMILFTGVIYALVLAQLWDPTGWQKIADETLHYSVPVMAIGGFLFFGPRPRFSLETLWRSLWIPLVYAAYTMVRGPLITYIDGGETRHWYPYPFINVDDLGYGRTVLNIAGLITLFVVVGWLCIFLDRKLPASPTTQSEQ
jgi:hypothetical protein